MLTKVNVLCPTLYLTLTGNHYNDPVRGNLKVLKHTRWTSSHQQLETGHQVGSALANHLCCSWCCKARTKILNALLTRRGTQYVLSKMVRWSIWSEAGMDDNLLTHCIIYASQDRVTLIHIYHSTQSTRNTQCKNRLS